MRAPTADEESLLTACGPAFSYTCDYAAGETMSEKDYQLVMALIKLGWMELVPCGRGCSHAHMTPAGREAMRLKALANDTPV